MNKCKYMQKCSKSETSHGLAEMKDAVAHVVDLHAGAEVGCSIEKCQTYQGPLSNPRFKWGTWVENSEFLCSW